MRIWRRGGKGRERKERGKCWGDGYREKREKKGRLK